MMTEQQFEAMTDAEKVSFLAALVDELSESLNRANALIRALSLQVAS